ncbi:MAG: multiple resistance and pH regulation protein F [Candidatus Omnitrophica bacterium]|nr:multiple resistance and pH regulation protein F [Candidatus Omnitrophota bacterium]
MSIFRWITGTIALIAGVLILVFSDMPLLTKYLMPFLVAGFLALFRLIKGPTAADRAVASDVLGILIVGICAIFAIFTGKDWYMDIGIAWALQSFIGILALAKYLEGRDFDA